MDFPGARGDEHDRYKKNVLVGWTPCVANGKLLFRTVLYELNAAVLVSLARVARTRVDGTFADWYVHVSSLEKYKGCIPSRTTLDLDGITRTQAPLAGRIICIYAPHYINMWLLHAGLETLLA